MTDCCCWVGGGNEILPQWRMTRVPIGFSDGEKFMQLGSICWRTPRPPKCSFYYMLRISLIYDLLLLTPPFPPLFLHHHRRKSIFQWWPTKERERERERERARERRRNILHRHNVLVELITDTAQVVVLLLKAQEMGLLKNLYFYQELHEPAWR